MNENNSIEFARKARIEVAKVLNRSNDSHIGGGYSSMDILAVLYSSILNISKDNLEDMNRDVFILSKGHIAASFYTVLALKGIIPMEDLTKHLKNGERYAGHTRKYQTDGVPGVEMSAGSLGHGPCVGAGMAYAKRLQKLGGKVYVLMGDGECNEGSVWEAAMFAARFKLTNLCFIVDHNHLQAYGRDEQVLNMGDLVPKFQSFGCDTVKVDGHNHKMLYHTFADFASGKAMGPKVVIAETIKGKGASFMEDRLEWHFKSPNDEQLEQIIKEQGL
ncbi:transketolase subunit A [Lachnospiraceae bacterium KHCPX20]|nr:transketolase subunit A [Lachnospiraceae bacterium KHCPX20]